jgi:hypothetical protein
MRSNGIEETNDVFRRRCPRRPILRRGQSRDRFICADVCRYGSTFCDNPHYVLVGSGLAAVWGAFVSIK